MASTPLIKGTRKTYSFEEREILVKLIYKYVIGNVDDKSSIVEAGSGSKRKSVWTQLTEEYNLLVGPENTRSSTQLRRCWENMKANKKSRDDKRSTENKAVINNNQPSTSTHGLPPNVVFQPKDSEPFAFEGIMSTAEYQNLKLKKEDLSVETIDDEPLTIDRELDDSSINADEPQSKKMKKKNISPIKKQSKQKFQRVKQQEDGELFDYKISEAQVKLETAAILKEEAKLKLEEAEYKKEEARMRMICANYKLQKLREECEETEEEDTKSNAL